MNRWITKSLRDESTRVHLKGFDLQSVLNTGRASIVSHADTIVMPVDRIEFAMQFIFSAFFWRMMERRKLALEAP